MPELLELVVLYHTEEIMAHGDVIYDVYVSK